MIKAGALRTRVESASHGYLDLSKAMRLRLGQEAHWAISNAMSDDQELFSAILDLWKSCLTAKIILALDGVNNND